jgi:hypothetical protein
MQRSALGFSATALAGFITIFAGNVLAAEGVTVTIKNDSSFTFEEMYLSPTSTNQWGPDQLGAQVVAPGGTFALNNIPAGSYDFKLIDEDQDTCTVSDVALAANETVAIDDDNLIGCQVASAGEEEGEEEEG